MLKPHEVAKLPEGKHCDERYLYLQVRGLNRSWIVRGPRDANGRRREAGLGSTDKVSLSLARQRRDELLKQWMNGIDPVEAKRQAREALAKKKTFREVAELVIELKSEGRWRKSALTGESATLGNWRRDLENNCKPIMSRFVDEIDVAAVRAVLEPHLEAKHYAAAKMLLGRLEQIFNYAIGEEWRALANPAAWKAHAHRWEGAPLGKRHHAALPADEAPELLRKLRASDAMAARIVEFVLLTAVRSGEARGARWSEIDFERRLWTIPAGRMKKGREHVVPLSDAAIALLRRMESERIGAFVFPAVSNGYRFGSRMVRIDRPAPNRGVWAFTKRAAGGEATTHGFRSTFRDWCRTRRIDREHAELCLAHSLGNETEQAYARDTVPELRRPIMEAWALFLEGAETSNVIPLKAVA